MGYSAAGGRELARPAEVLCECLIRHLVRTEEEN
jgi:hypothetical protein